MAQPDDLFEHAPCGYVVTDGDGMVVAANVEFLRMVGHRSTDVISVRTLASLLSVGGRIFLETHLFPMLEHNAVVREIDLDLITSAGEHLPVLLNASLTSTDGSLAVRAVFIEARDRHRYEDNLRHATRAAEQAREHAAELAETLQQTLIPPAPPEIPLLKIAAAYRPAGNGREVGGDFYDVFQVSHTAWVVVLGDVSGKGIRAATVTSLVRYTVRSLAIAHPDPADLLRHVDIALQANDTDRYSTLVVVRLERRAGGWDLQLSLAGHPPALLREPDGTVTEIGTPGSPVGLVHDPAFSTIRHRLRNGAVILYTDGVTEARGPHGLFGEDRLHDLLASLPHDPHAITEGIAQAALDYQNGNASDDIAIVTFADEHAPRRLTSPNENPPTRGARGASVWAGHEQGDSTRAIHRDPGEPAPRPPPPDPA